MGANKAGFITLENVNLICMSNIFTYLTAICLKMYFNYTITCTNSASPSPILETEQFSQLKQEQTKLFRTYYFRKIKTPANK